MIRSCVAAALACAAVSTAMLVVACSSDDSSSGASSADASVEAGGGGTAADAGPRTAASADADAGPASEGMVSGAGSFGMTSLAGLTNALSEVTSAAVVSQGTELQVVLAQLASCGDVDGGPSANAVFLELSMYTNAPGTDGGASRVAATTPGTYDLDESGPGPYAQAYVIVFDDTCHADLASGKLASGTVTVTAITASSVTGSYTLTGDIGPVTGTFSTVPCTGAYDLVAPASTANCH